MPCCLRTMTESQKENWKCFVRFLVLLVDEVRESQKENWKPQPGSWSCWSISRYESQKENWKLRYTKTSPNLIGSILRISKRELKAIRWGGIHVRSMSLRNLKKRIERSSISRARRCYGIRVSNLKKRIESYPLGEIDRVFYAMPESQKENWKVKGHALAS